MRIDEQKEVCLNALNKLETAYQNGGDKTNALKIGGELDKIAEQVDVEMHASRQFLLSEADKPLQKGLKVDLASESQVTPELNQEIRNAESLENAFLENTGNQAELIISEQQATQTNNNIEQLPSSDDSAVVVNEIGAPQSGSSGTASGLNTTLFVFPFFQEIK